jgi:hypothetical protein
MPAEAESISQRLVLVEEFRARLELCCIGLCAAAFTFSLVNLTLRSLGTCVLQLYLTLRGVGLGCSC